MGSLRQKEQDEKRELLERRAARCAAAEFVGQKEVSLEHAT